MTGGDPRPGLVEPEVAVELPGLTVWELTVEADLQRGRDPGVRDRLRELAGRFTGAVVIEARQDEIVHAYRVAYRHVGMDPDVDRTPYEAALVERLRLGGFPSKDVLTDALLLALLDTKVGVTAFDEAALDGPVRVTTAGEPARIVVADDARPLAPLFAEPPDGLAPAVDATALRLVAVTPAGVPAIAAWEALDRVAQLVAP